MKDDSALGRALEHTVPSGYFLDGLNIPKTLYEVRTILVRNRLDIEEHLAQACHSDYERLCKRIELYFYPCSAEVDVTLKIFQEMSYFYRCLAIDRDWVRAINSQIAAFSYQKLEVLPRPANVVPCLHLVDYSAGMGGAAFLQRLNERLGKAIPREPVKGMPSLSQVPFLPVLIPSRPNIKAFADRFYYELDGKVESHHLMNNRKAAFAKRHPELYMQFLLQVYNVGVLLVYVPDGENLKSDSGRKFLLFLEETTNAIGIPVFLLGPPVVMKAAASVPSIAGNLISNSTRVHRYSNADGQKAVQGFIDELGGDIASLLDIEAIASLPEAAGHQRNIIWGAMSYAIKKSCAKRGDLVHFKSLLDAYVACFDGMVNAVEYYKKNNRTNEVDMLNYSQFLPWDAQLPGKKLGS